MQATPKVVYLRGTPRNGRFRITGPPEITDWAKIWRKDKEPWCEINITREGKVTSFGGELWPSAWPSLFNTKPTTTAGICTELTPLGILMFTDAVGKARKRREIVGYKTNLGP